MLGWEMEPLRRGACRPDLGLMPLIGNIEEQTLPAAPDVPPRPACVLPAGEDAAEGGEGAEAAGEEGAVEAAFTTPEVRRLPGGPAAGWLPAGWR